MVVKRPESSSKVVKFGRQSNVLKIGLVGLPNVGKSTTFNLLTKCRVAAENFPFCTIDPNEAVVSVSDDRFDFLCSLHKPKSVVPAVLRVVDIAGLVPGAHKGEGLGNSFLSHISAVDGIYHVCRAFSAESVTHTEGAVDPIRDLEIIRTELIAKDLSLATSCATEARRKYTQNKKLKDIGEEADTLEKVVRVLTGDEVVYKDSDQQTKHNYETGKKGFYIKDYTEWTTNDVRVINSHGFLTTKPMLYLVNMSAIDFERQKTKFPLKIKRWVDEHGGGPVIPFSAEFETSLLGVGVDVEGDVPKDANTLHNSRSALSRIIKTGYSHLGLINFFTCGPDEVRSWTIRSGTLAPQAGGVIHTDFEKGFICVDTIKYDDLFHLKTEAEVKSKGKLTQNGKKYEVADGDILNFRFNVGRQGKD